MNRDFVEILSELSAAGADYLIVGRTTRRNKLDETRVAGNMRTAPQCRARNIG